MSTPIALPSPHHSQDSSMSYGSYGTNGSFNPASYTRHVLGSPLSWRATGSFGGRFYPGSSPVSDSNDFKSAKLSSSVDSDRGRNTLNAFDREGDLCRNYTCCGLNLTDLHALLEHFEEVHVVVVDPQSQHSISPPFPNSTTNANVTTPTALQPQSQQPSYFPDIAGRLQTHRQRQHRPSRYSPEQNTGPFDPDDMELDLDTSTTITAPASVSSPLSSGAPSPPDTPISTPLSSYSPSLVYAASQCSSPLHTNPDLIDPSPISAFETTTVLRPLPHHSNTVNNPVSNSTIHPTHSRALNAFPPSRATRPAGLVAPDAFNAYAGYSDYSSSMPGTVPSPPTSVIEAQHVGIGMGGNIAVPQGPRMVGNGTVSEPTSPYAHGCVPPALLFSNNNTPANTPPASRVPSPSPMSTRSFSNPRSQTSSTSQSTTPRTSTTLSRPASSLLLSKPFKCPKPNCNKSYKQANGLKYHITHGSCNFAPPKDLEHVQALLASKRRANANANAAKEDAAGNSNSASSSSPTSPNSTPSQLSPSSSATEVDIGFGLTDSDLREVEREAARRVRPFACGVGDCQRRYKNMNGLRYHYQHSGDHGAIGLALLAGGVHECLVGASSKRANGTASARGSRHGSREREKTGRSGSASASGSAVGSGTSTPACGGTHGSGQFSYTGFSGQRSTQHSPSPPQQQQVPSHTQHAQAQSPMGYQSQFAHHQRQPYQGADATGNGMYMGMNVKSNVGEFNMSG